MTIPLEVASAEEEDVARLVAAEFERPYDLEHGPCFRPRLWRVGSGEHVFMVAAHHTVMDLAAMTTLQDELWTAYEGGELPEVAADYAEFVAWQASLLAGAEGERQGAFWAEQLGPAPAVLQLPTDRPRPPLQSLRGDTVPFVVDAETTAAVAALAREEGSSTFRLLLTLFVVLLHRYTEQTEILTGSPAGGRTAPQFAGIVSHCVNMLPIRTDLSGSPTFRTLMRQVNDTTLAAIANQDFPFPVMVERLQPARDASRSPLFQVAFSFQRSDIPQLPNFVISLPGQEGFRRGGLDFVPFTVSQQNGQFDLALWMARPADKLTGELKYATDLFDRSTAERAVSHLRTLLAAVVADPDRSVGELALLPPDELEQVVVDWNRTEHPFDDHLCMHELFEQQVDRAPDAVAAVFGGRVATYGEVEADANRLAHLFRERGAAPGRLVAVYLDRSLEIPAALLGIHKSGSGYVPLDTSHPRARIELILSSLPVSAVVTQRRHLPWLQQLDVANFARPDRARRRLGRRRRASAVDGVDAGRPVGAPGDASTACVEPHRHRVHHLHVRFDRHAEGRRGVHRPAVNLIQWVNSTFGVGPADRLLMVTSLCFDLSVYDIFGVLGAGGSLYLVSADELRDPTRLVSLLLEQPITFWDSAPPALSAARPVPACRAHRPPAAARAAQRRLDPRAAARPDPLRVPGSRGRQPRRRHRSDHLVERVPDRRGRAALGEHPVRQADLERPLLRARPAAQPVPDRRPR